MLEIAVTHPESFPLCLALIKDSSWLLMWSYIIQKNFSITTGARVRMAFERGRGYDFMQITIDLPLKAILLL